MGGVTRGVTTRWRDFLGLKNIQGRDYRTEGSLVGVATRGGVNSGRGLSVLILISSD